MAFALAREAARRHTGMRHFRVQLLGGAAMMTGALAEMQTGEGKTLTALLPAVAAALMGRRVHIVTVNDYLARRDAEQLRPVFHALGLGVGLVVHGQSHEERQRAYACDITYCTNKELVFDYLRDRLALGTRRARARLLVDDLFGNQPARRSQSLLLRSCRSRIGMTPPRAAPVRPEDTLTCVSRTVGRLRRATNRPPSIRQTELRLARHLRCARNR